MMKLLLGMALALLAAGPARAQVQTTEKSNPVPGKANSGKLDQLICERVERTGSRLDVEKVCMTALQWKEHRQGQREDVEKVQRIVNQGSSR